MSKRSKNPTKISTPEIIELFQKFPEEAYQKLISSGIYFKNKQSRKFWTAFSQLDFGKLRDTFPKSVGIFNRACWLKAFHDLYEFYSKEKVRLFDELIALNPEPEVLIKALFLCLELGETNPKSKKTPNYSEESLEAIKILLKEITPKLKNESQATYSPKMVDLSYHLIRIQTDIDILDDFVDTYMWGGFEMSKKEDGMGFLLEIGDIENKDTNLFVLNYLKNQIKRDFKRKESHPKISEEEHFQKNDPIWKTNEGLAVAFCSSGFTMTSQTPGTTFIQVKDDLFNNIVSDDEKIRNEATFKVMMLQQEQNFHYQFRKALSRIYQPNDEINIHDMHLQIEPDVYVSLFDIICCMSCLIARADAFKHLYAFPETGSVRMIKSLMYWVDLKSNYPEITETELHENCNALIIRDLCEWEKHYDTIFTFIFEDTILSWFGKIEELKSKTAIELKSILHLLSGLNSQLSFNPLYKVGDKYYFSYVTCCEFDLNRELYDKYISDKLFNPNNKPDAEKPIIGVLQNNRAICFTNSIKELLRKITPYAESEIEYGDPKMGYDFGELTGGFDVIAYFENENIIFPIQVKLSNVSPRTEKRKEEWITNHIINKGLKQIVKDIKLLNTQSGLNFVADKLNIAKKIINPKIYPLIVTDNFFVDHGFMQYNEKGATVYCISYFELKHLICNIKIHEKQSDWNNFEENKSMEALIDIIDNNTFWNFLKEYAENYTYSKSLSYINMENRIEMII